MTLKPSHVNLIFSLAPDVSMEQALQALSVAKVNIDQPLSEIGMILGSGRRSQLTMLRKLSAFQSVDIDSIVQIAPPDDPVQ